MGMFDKLKRGKAANAGPESDEAGGVAADTAAANPFETSSGAHAPSGEPWPAPDNKEGGGEQAGCAA